MDFLKQLLCLTENVDTPIEVADVIRNFPSRYKAALKSLWGKDRLVFNGLSFFADNGIYDQLDDAVSKFAKSSRYHGIDVELETHYELDGKTIELSYMDDSDPADLGQEVYVGFSPNRNILLVGYDAGLSEDLFNEEWDKQWVKTFGRRVEFDNDNSEHSALYNDIWKQFSDMNVHVVFEVTVKNGKVQVIQQADSDNLTTRFYSAGLKSLKSRYSDLVDLRLD